MNEGRAGQSPVTEVENDEYPSIECVCPSGSIYARFLRTSGGADKSDGSFRN